MATSYAEALKTYLEPLITPIKVYRRRAPERLPLPYVIVSGTIALVPIGAQDGGPAQGGDSIAEQTLQVSLFQQVRDPITDSFLEDMTLEDTLLEKLHGAMLTAAPKRVYGISVINAVELPDPDPLVVQLAITIVLHRTL